VRIAEPGFCWEGRNAVEDGGAVAGTNQPKQDHHPGRGRDGCRLVFSFLLVFRLQRRRRA